MRGTVAKRLRREAFELHRYDRKPSLIQRILRKTVLVPLDDSEKQVLDLQKNIAATPLRNRNKRASIFQRILLASKQLLSRFQTPEKERGKTTPQTPVKEGETRKFGMYQNVWRPGYRREYLDLKRAYKR